MAFHWCDNVHTTSFTPRDYQVELLASASEQNTMLCLGHKSSKEFIALKLLQEKARELRQNRSKVSLYLSRLSGESAYNLIYHLTDLKVYNEAKQNDDSDNAIVKYGEAQVLILKPKTCLRGLKNGDINMENVNLIVLEDCHEIKEQSDMFLIFRDFYSKLESKPKVLALAGPLHSAGCAPEDLNAMLEILEKKVYCKAETASDIVTVLRYCTKPTEFIVQCDPPQKDKLTMILEDIICTRKAFLKDHRYDPSEIYSDEFLEELKGIPDPKIEPTQFLDIYLESLHEMGPWCADRVAISLIQQIEKQKIKTPYERHYLLLCMVITALLEIHTLCEQAFHEISTERERVEKYSSPKVLRLLEVLRLFKPEEIVSENEQLGNITKEIDKLNFHKLKQNLENTFHTVENLSKSISKDIIENLDPILKPTYNSYHSNNAANHSENNLRNGPNGLVNSLKNRRNQNTRHKKRPFARRHNRDAFADPDALCGIIFCNNKYTAKVLFDLLAEMSRHDSQLKFLKCQFTTDRVADPIAEPKEAELEHRRQEDVLKRFRIHDCNLLIGTSVLEEGIDLPKCNLVVRWNPPSTYRSYVQCKGRARAAQAYHVILVAPNFAQERFSYSSDLLTDTSHRIICTESAKSAEDYVIKEALLQSEIVEDISQPKPIIIEHSSGASVKILNPEVIARSLAASVVKLPKSIVESNRISEISYQSSTENQSTTDLSETLNASIESNNSSDSKSEKKRLRKKDLENCYEVVPIAELISPNVSVDDDELKPITNGDDTKEEHIDVSVKQNEVEEYKCSIEEIVEEKSVMTQGESAVQDMENATNEMVDRLAQYREIEKMLLQKCANTEPSEEEHQEADKFTNCIEAYKPLPELLTGAAVDLSTAIALINKYCAKLPSDTFTKLTPLSRCAKTKRCGKDMYQYTLRLPINSPLKYDIVGLPMPTKILARRMVALQACRELHMCGELDNTLQPIGKEGFKAFESDWEEFELEKIDEQIVTDNAEPRPGTTKRRQYYYKRIASEFSNCRPTAGAISYLYYINLTLQCPIPEEQNTRGRKIYPPEEALQGFGILTLKKIPKVSAFPIFTRSGEVKVSIDLAKKRIVLSEDQVARINTFVNYTFSNVLRLQKFLMLFDVDSTENCVFIVPTIKTKKSGIVIDWDFLEVIARDCNMMPQIVPDEVRQNKEFDANKFKDAVVMPWYRNQDQPQYFYVAEICPHLTPLSCFPGENYNTFKHYYFVKYGITIQNANQPLLDVDHTSARLNFLTPRYVNRKGVALPTSSEETKRAKRENLEQKQILVPELCTIHPFPASLWRTAVCLPCILYRVNGLLLADEIRKKVSYDIALGCMEIEDENFEWPILDFGWSLAEVLKKNKESKTENLDELISETKPPPPVVTEVRKEPEIVKEEKKIILEEPEIIKVEKSANEIVLEGEEKLKADTFIEIGTWSNDMANSMSEEDTDMEDEEFCSEFLPPNVSFCKTEYDIIKSDKPTRYGSPTFWDVEDSVKSKLDRKKNSSFIYSSDESFTSNYDYDDEILSSSGDENDGPLRIEFTSDNVAEAIETEDEILKRQKQMSIIQDTIANERDYQVTKNLQVGYNFDGVDTNIESELKSSEEAFLLSTERLKKEIHSSGMLVRSNQLLTLPKKQTITEERYSKNFASIKKLFPYLDENVIMCYIALKKRDLQDLQLSITDVEKLNRIYLEGRTTEKYYVDGNGDMFDSFNDHSSLTSGGQKEVVVNFDQTIDKNKKQSKPIQCKPIDLKEIDFSFDNQPDLVGHPGPSPSIILQGLTMSNANDGINLERLETIGDSFLKYAITTYLYITYENVHEGKLSHLRSKQVANLNLYRLGRKKMLGECMIATKFEPHDNWLPPCYYVPRELEKTLIKARIPPHHWKLADLPNIKQLSSEELLELVRKKAEKLGQLNDDLDSDFPRCDRNECMTPDSADGSDFDFQSLIPYNLVTQHSIPDKSVADCVEALIGAYLIECGPRGALLFMAWLGIRVLPAIKQKYDPNAPRIPGSTRPTDDNDEIIVYGSWSAPKSPLLEFAPNPREQLESLLDGYTEFEAAIGYSFNDRSYLLQAMTHASYSPNRLTDCYQRLEFLGDAVLDYLITRHLYEDPRQHSPGALTDLRSALVNNTIFASLAVRHGFHKYFRHLSPGLNEVIDRFVRIQHENGHSISEEYYLLSEEECDDAEDVEVPKALGDVFESIAGAIFLDSNMSLDVVWKIYSNMMKPEIEQFSNSVPKSPIRELLELEPETAKFGKPEKLADGRRVRVTVEVFCKGTFRGIGRNYRIAKCTAAKCALRQLKKQGHISKKH
ncbi:endoribonuclease Dcr-1 [Episyrphus balteatus]|uniref:endoribonuclease Dcr-1 n=1 Tax=Episyrphus balteatus TaxID=286459 RepID=UPI002484EFB2|nr:endoribonuclease Dcr-1 [Episyrphus balteatus]